MRGMGMARGATAAAAMGLALGGVQTAAAAPAGMTTTRLAVTVSGSQTTDWVMDRTAYDGCVDGDVRTHGAGRERFTFRSTRAGAADLLQIGDDAALSAARGLPVRGTVERRGDLRVDQLSGGESFCGGTENPTPPPAPDCGRRSWRGALTPIVVAAADWPPDRRPAPRGPVLELNGPALDGDRAFGDLFANCPGTEGLLLLASDAVLRVRRVVHGPRRTVITADETTTTDADGFRQTTTVRWRAVLVRRGGPQRTPDGRGRPQCSNGRDDDGDGRADFPRDRDCRSATDRSER